MPASFTDQTPELPSLEDSCYLLETSDTATGPLQSLVLDHLLLNDGDAYWVDAAGHARSDMLAGLAPSNRLLDRVHVARGFTAYQHTTLVEHLLDRVDDDTGLIVLPAVDAMYRADDVQEPFPEAMLELIADRLETIRREYDGPIVLTCLKRDSLTGPVVEQIDQCIQCEETPFGPRFVGDDFETLVYPANDGTVQTTLAFWERVLAERAATINAAGSGVTAYGAN